MRLAINIAIVLVIGLAVGGLSARFALQRTFGIGAINVGVWSAWPFVGGAEVDPYTAARSTVDGVIPLGAAEGLAFESLTDEKGRALRRECSYLLFGNTPAARELLSNLVFEVCWSCGDLTGLRFFNSVFEPDACDDFWEVLEAS